MQLFHENKLNVRSHNSDYEHMIRMADRYHAGLNTNPKCISVPFFVYIRTVYFQPLLCSDVINDIIHYIPTSFLYLLCQVWLQGLLPSQVLHLNLQALIKRLNAHVPNWNHGPLLDSSCIQLEMLC